MITEAHWEASGLSALLQEESFPRWFTLRLRAAHRQAWQEWARLAGSSRFGLRARFGTQAWGKFGFTPRSAAYQRRQRYWLGNVVPYQSPYRNRPLIHHARGKMDAEGVGWRVGLRKSEEEVVSVLTLPGMRAMNFPQNQRYRREFLALHKRAPEREWIMARVEELLWDAVKAKAKRTGKRRLRSVV